MKTPLSQWQDVIRLSIGRRHPASYRPLRPFKSPVLFALKDDLPWRSNLRPGGVQDAPLTGRPHSRTLEEPSSTEEEEEETTTTTLRHDGEEETE